jgi:SlyX protein
MMIHIIEPSQILVNMDLIMPDHDLRSLLQRVSELETQVTFQEQTITDLNHALATQQQDLIHTQRTLAIFNQKLQLLEQCLTDDNEAILKQPPHY